MTISFFRFHPEAIIPVRATPGSIGFDLHALVLTEKGRRNHVVLPPRYTQKVRTGIGVTVGQSGFLATVWSRSGMASKSVFVANSPGLIDPDYVGEIMVLLYNGSHETQFIAHEDRIAQLVFIPSFYDETPSIVAEQPAPTERGAGGFGSTGR